MTPFVHPRARARHFPVEHLPADLRASSGRTRITEAREETADVARARHTTQRFHEFGARYVSDPFGGNYRAVFLDFLERQ